jgi:FAD:protein FMN transferase
VTAERRFAVMGTTAHIAVVGEGGGDQSSERLAARAETALRGREARWSRFLATSEISRLNAAGGKPTLLSADTYTVIDQAVAAWWATAGRFDPTVLPALRAAGYDRTFDEIAGEPVVGAVRPPEPAPGCAGIELDPRIHLVRLPTGVEIDLGGIGKGAAADLIAAEILAEGGAGVCINVGGDVRAAGIPPSERGWIVGVACPGAVEPPLNAVALSDGAVCTSTTLKRRWTTAAGQQHHLIDPRSGAPVDSDFVSVTVIGARAAQAEVWTKVAFMSGLAAIDELEANEVAAIMVRDDGSCVSVGALEELAA